MTADPWPEPGAMPLVFREGRAVPDGPYLLQINGVDVPSSVLTAVRRFTRSQAAEIQRLRDLVGEAIDAGASNDGDTIARIRRDGGLT